jgi:hypothetical protein
MKTNVHPLLRAMRPHLFVVIMLAACTTTTKLAAKGFSYVAEPSQADFAVDFSVGAQARLEASSYPTYFRGPSGSGASGNEVDCASVPGVHFGERRIRYPEPETDMEECGEEGAFAFRARAFGGPDSRSGDRRARGFPANVKMPAAHAN